MAIATINRLITLFDGAFKALGAPATMAESERLAMIVQFAMDSRVRAYHTSAHIFDLVDGMSPRQVLAALFHDLVYFQLDDGFPESTVEIFQDVVRIREGALILRRIAPDDTVLGQCAAVFDFQCGQELPLYAGMNEFLSAVVAARLLQPHLDTMDLLAVVACIEASIPFRSTAMDGTSSADILAGRLNRVCQSLQPAWPETVRQAYVDRVVTEGVQFANRDVGSFAHDDPGLFFSSTWLLIDESNAPRKRLGVYTLRQYRDVLMRMESFLGMLNPESVFQRYQDTPSKQEWSGLVAAATRNIAFACDFLDAKIASVAIIEALAMATGADCPVSMFLGDIRSTQGRPDRVHDYLPEVPQCASVDEHLLEIFEKGRNLGSQNDLGASPLAAFVYRYLGFDGTRTTLRHARDMFAGITTPLAFLQTQNRDMVAAIITGCSHIALSRAAALQSLQLEAAG